MDNSFKSVIDSAESILILLPTKPFFDQVAAGLSLYLSLEGSKKVSIHCPIDMTVEFNRLVGVNKISKELGGKNLTLKLSDYPAERIERVSYDIVDEEFRLTIIPKPGEDSPNKEQVILGYSGVDADTAILIGGANESHFPAISSKDMTGVKTLHIGTRDLSVSSMERAVLSFARPASSVSEIIAQMIKDMGAGINPDIATNLLAGIEEGSLNFSNPATSAETFEMVAYLIKKGGRRKSQMDVANREDFPKGAIPEEKIGSFENDDGSEAPEDWTGPKIYKGNALS